MRVANLAQDLGIVMREVRTLRLEVESLRSENATLRKQVASIGGVRAQLTVINDNLLSQVSALKKEIAAGGAQVRKEVLTEVAKQIRALGEQTDDTLKSILNAINMQPSAGSVEEPVTFDKDYPEQGIVYQVQSGDTLIDIAKKLNSRVTWIQNANMIADRNKLQAGQSLFIPQAE